MATDINKKSTKTPWNDPDSDVDPKYPYLYGQKDPSGKYEFAYSSPYDMGAVSTEKSDSTGSYEAFHAHQGKKGDKDIVSVRTRHDSGEVRSDIVGGNATQTQGHDHIGKTSTGLTETDGDEATQTGGNTYDATHGRTIDTRVEGKTSYSNGSSKSLDLEISRGDKAYRYEGDISKGYEGDHVVSVNGNDLRMVESGDHGLHIQEGNYDVDIKGLARIFSEDEMLIESLTKITIKVGNSTIILTPDNIELDSPRIDLN